MNTKYLDNEIELLNAIKRNNELSDYGKEKLSEFNAIKKALTIPVVSQRSELLPDFLYKDDGIIRVGVHGDSAVTDEWNEYLKKLGNCG